MDFNKIYGGGGEPNDDFRLSENNLFMDLKIKNKLPTTKVHSLISNFFEQSHVSLVCHKEFLSELDAGKIYCKVCLINMDSLSELSEHLQTKSHEDRIIMLIKSNLPPSLHKHMEFVTFYDSNLYCNLCKCNISWSSENPFKTIVDIIAHNESSNHLSKKTNNIKPTTNNDDSLGVLQALAEVDSLLGENIKLIDYKVQPLFKCKLCKKVIEFEENQSQMLINFSLHLNSEGHKKCLKTFLVLKSFEESHLSKIESRHCLSVVKDKIFCTCSSRSINPTVECLLAHISQKLDVDCNEGLSSELSSIIAEEPNFSATSILSTPSLTDFSERYNGQIEPTPFARVPLEISREDKSVLNSSLVLNNKYESCDVSVSEGTSFVTDFSEMFNEQLESASFTRALLETSRGNKSVHNTIALNDKYESYDNSVLEGRNSYTHTKGNSDVYSVLNKLENTNFFVSKVSKYLAKVNNQVMCDVCDAVICCSSDEKLLKDSIKQHFIGDKHKNFMEKLTFDEKETIVKLTFENPTIQANKQYIKASGKYLHCIICQFTVTLCLDHESLQKKLAAHCLGKYHLEEIGKPYNAVFEARPLSSQSTSAIMDPAKQLKTSPDKRPGSEEKVKNKNSLKEGFNRPNPGSENGKQHNSDIPPVDRLSLHNDPNAIKILNLIPDLSSKSLISLLKSFGPLRHFYLSKDLKTGLCKGFALVHYQTRQSAERALTSLNGLPTTYGTLTVKWAY